MSKAPIMPFYVDAYLADTLHLTTEEHGAYLMLLFAMWRANGKPLPDDDARLARICGLTRARWRKLRPHIEPLLLVNVDGVTQRKLHLTWNDVQQKIAICRVKGAKGGRATSARRLG